MSEEIIEKIKQAIEGYKDKTEWLDSYYKNTSNSVVLAYTNDQVRNYNETIRKHELKINAGNRFEVDEKIMFNNFYKANHVEINDQTMNYYTSYQVHIKNCREDMYSIDYTKILQRLKGDLQHTQKDPSLLDELIKKLPNNIPIYYLVTEGDYYVHNPIHYSKLQQALEELKNEFIIFHSIVSGSYINLLCMISLSVKSS
jgi:hypothetical protein